MSDQAPFGMGILSGGQAITSPEEHRLVAKRAWLQLWDYLMMNNEVLKSRHIPIPWSLDEDIDIGIRRSETAQKLQRFRNREEYLKYILDSEGYYTKDIIDQAWQASMQRERIQWVVEQTASENPLTVLDVGTGFGELALNIAQKGYQVTAISPHKRAIEWLNEIAKERKFPCQFIEGIIEDIDFGGRRFDVVLLCEVLEHVLDDRGVLAKCCDLAEKAVIVTTPRGSCENGICPNSNWRISDEHVRAYSNLGFKSLVASMTDFKASGDIKVIRTLNGYRGQPIGCFCVKLLRKEVEKPNVDTSIQAQGAGNVDADPVEKRASGRVQPTSVS